MLVAKLREIEIHIHPTLFALLAMYAALGLVAQALLVFTLVISHELAHLLTARAYGFRVVALEIFPLGGVAHCNDTFEGRRVEESLMALAGPAWNILLLFCGQVLRWQGLWNGPLADDFVRLNFWLAAFNLVPVLPLDGGRVVRACAAGSFGFVRSTKTLARAGQLFGLGLVCGGLVTTRLSNLAEGSVFLVILGAFLWWAGGKEVATARLTFLRQLARKKEELVRKGLMPGKVVTVRADTPLIRIVEELTPDRYALVVLTGEKFGVAKTFTETEIVEGMLRDGIRLPVGKL